MRGPGRSNSAPPAGAAGPAPRRADRSIATIPAHFRGRARRDAAAFYLSELARGVLAGEIAVGIGERATALASAEFVALEIEVKQKKRANHVAVRLWWPKRPLIRVGPAGRDASGG
jgi:amphi-Trp domain-containing protein